ncbi:MAG TPA: DUF2804 domain-containing protein [Anaeromyxobacter sp.]|nr:DUF2804 domain-containing protein [Anaeromyxobacter sp.]
MAHPPPLAAPPPALLDAAGAPRLGAFAGDLPAVELAALAPPGVAGRLSRVLRGKRWLYAMAASDGVLAALAIVEAGWFAGGFAWALDRRSGAVLWEGSAAGLPGRHATVAAGARGAAAARLRARGLALGIAREGGAWRLSAASADGAFALEGALDAAGAPAPFALVVPVPGGGVRATQKAAALRASGTVRVRGRTLALAGGSGGVDLTAGLLARETSWRWAFGTGRAGGAPLGLNLCAGFGVPDGDPGENAGFGGAAPWRLPPVAFDVGGAGAPWRIASASRAVDLVFRPQGAHREARNLGVLRTRFAQVAGTFEGTIPGRAGEPVELSGLPGVVEDHWAVW